MAFTVTANTSTGFSITAGAAGGSNQVYVKIAGTFVLKDINTKIGGSFANKPIAVKSGGTF